MQNLVWLHQFVLKILSGNKILTRIKGHSSVVNKRKLTCNNPNIDLFKVHAYAKFDQIPPICSQATEWNEILMIIKGHNCVVYLPKLTSNNPNLDLVNVNAYAKFGLTATICSQDIEWKRSWNGRIAKWRTSWKQYTPPHILLMRGYKYLLSSLTRKNFHPLGANSLP